MKIGALFAITLLVALIATSEARAMGSGRQVGDNKPAAECFKCPRPTRDIRVCAFDGVSYRTFPSRCMVDRKACKTGSSFTVVSDGACPLPTLPNPQVDEAGGDNKPAAECSKCPRPTRDIRVCAFDGVSYRTFPSRCMVDRNTCRTGSSFTIVSRVYCFGPDRQVFDREDDSDSDSEEIPENNDTDGGGSPITSAPVTPSTVPSQPPTTLRTVFASGTDTFSLPNGTTLPSGSLAPSMTAQTSSPAAGTPASGDPAASISVTSRPCNSFDSCAPSSSVCGTDGNTYPSQCVLEVTACVDNLDTLTVAYAGVCRP
ncbi:uncharacterized protein LOC110983806 [Acanthaster planci]|uniref:Uncharacterized protein LOC110983806 n=1 Tax=Acanthaster planci TaxID=133434 RepID=A0A8B7Z6W4_ACAPL|nr:uncharacterized protein LOC110983806 [Acanthaster planci]